MNKSVFVTVALLFALLQPLSSVSAKTDSESEKKPNEQKDCLAGLGTDASLDEMTLMKLDFGTRTFQPGSKCAAPFEIETASGSDHVIGTCSVCGTRTSDEVKAIGIRKVIDFHAEQTAISAETTYLFNLQDKNSNPLKMSCHFKEPRYRAPSAKMFLVAMKHAGVECTQPPLPPEATLRPGDGETQIAPSSK